MWKVTKANNMETESRADASFLLARHGRLVLPESVRVRSEQEVDVPAAYQGDISARADNLYVGPQCQSRGIVSNSGTNIVTLPRLAVRLV